MLQPQFITVPALPVLTATGRGMVRGDMGEAARHAYAELWPAAHASGAWPPQWSCLAIYPDQPAGPDDPQCRVLGGVVFGYTLHRQQGMPVRRAVALAGSLAWHELAAGRCAVFTHMGPYSGLHVLWTAIYRDWLPATGYALRDAMPFELYVNEADVTPPQQLRTDIYVPVE